MQVHTIRVSYTREKQPKDYEKAAPAVEMSAAVDDGEDHAKASMGLMTDACRTVYAALGLDIPSSVAAKLGAGEAPKAAAKKADVKTAGDKEKAAVEDAEKDVEKKPKADDGIPDEDSSKKRTPPAEGKKAKGKKAEADDIPDEGAKKGRDISDNPEDRNPADDDGIPDEGDKSESDDGIPDGDTDPDTLTHDDLFQMIQARVADKSSGLNPAAVKEILAGYKVVRVSELDADKLQEVRDQVELACQK